VTIVIGVSGYFHESSICLTENAVLLDFLKEEEFTRIKGTKGFPHRSLTFLKNKYDLNEENVDKVVFYEKPLRGWAARVAHSLQNPRKSSKLLGYQLKQFWNGPIGFARDVRKVLPINENKIAYCPHHLSHVLSSTPFIDNSFLEKKTLHFVLDGVGDDECQSIFLTEGTSAERVFSEKYPHSLGLFYSTITDFCGFLVNEGEYKLMALAAYGVPRYEDIMRNEIIGHTGHRVQLNLAWFDFVRTPERSYSEKFIQHFGPPIRLSNLTETSHPDFIRAADLAKSAQATVEAVLTEIIKWGLSNYACDSVTITGGVAHNSLAIEAICKNPEISVPITVPPSPGDSGAAIGAAVYGNIINNKRFVSTNDIFFSNAPENINADLFKLLFNKLAGTENMDALIDRDILSGKIICTFFDKKEIGPRALGNRSILCAANNDKAVEKLNKTIKQREFYRPLAPIMLEKTAKKYFRLSPQGMKNYRWMALTAQASETFPDEYLPALHVDRSARIQIMQDNTHYVYKILNRLSGQVDMLINTSFNVAGDPIVHDIIDCYTNMHRLGIDSLITLDGYYKINRSNKPKLS